MIAPQSPCAAEIVFARCGGAPSSTRMACAPLATVLEISMRWAFIALVSTWGTTSAAVTPLRADGAKNVGPLVAGIA
ncbi:MAG: hypothetical protein COY86_03030, partial [Rhodobacterales bacterium CG_4_10_14_0_8_um_filter_70_9]